MLNGQIVCLDRDGRGNIDNVLFRHEEPPFYAFDLLVVDENLCDAPLTGRKRRLRRIRPRIETRLLYVDDLAERGAAMYSAACQRDLDGIVRAPRHRDHLFHAIVITHSSTS